MFKLVTPALSIPRLCVLAGAPTGRFNCVGGPTKVKTTGYGTPPVVFEGQSERRAGLERRRMGPQVNGIRSGRRLKIVKTE